MKHPLAFFRGLLYNENKVKLEDTMLTYKTEEGDAVYWSVDKCEGSHLFFGADSKPTPVTEAIIKLNNAGIIAKSIASLFIILSSI